MCIFCTLHSDHCTMFSFLSSCTLYMLLVFKQRSLSPIVTSVWKVSIGVRCLSRFCGASSNRQDESPSIGLSLNRSQRGNCSTEYNTPPGT